MIIMRYGKAPAVILLAVITAVLLHGRCLANAAESPLLILYAEYPESRIAVQFLADGKKIENVRRETEIRPSVVGAYYSVYGWLTIVPRNYYGEVSFSVEVTLAGGESFTADIPTEYGLGTANPYSLDIQNRKVVPGRIPLLTVGAAARRLAITLAIEGILFTLFGYRNKRSWMCFLTINLITQSLLSLWLLFVYMPHIPNYYIVAPNGSTTLIIIEIAITLAEAFALGRTVREFNKPRIIAFVWCANILSFTLGGVIIKNLPV